MDFGTNSGSQSQNQFSTGRSSTSANIPPLLQGLLGEVAGGATNSFATIPGISSLISSYPQQGVAGLTNAQYKDIHEIQGLATDPFALNPQEQSAANTYAQLEQGVNPAVAYGQKVFNDVTAPTVESASALSGMGNSGALGENLALAGEQMALPMAQQGYSMEATGAAGMAGLGEQSFNQGIQRLSMALEAAGIPQQVAQQILSSIYQRQIGQTQAGLNEQNALLEWLPALIGKTTSSVGTQAGSGTTSGNQFGIQL